MVFSRTSLDLSIIVPTMNEEEKISDLISKIMRYLKKVNYEILVVDDSNDRTPEIVRSLKNKRIRIFHREGKKGIGSAYVLGFKKSKGEIIITMDGDGSHDPKYLTKLLKLSGDFDVVIGSRYISSGKREDPISRRILPKFGSYLFRIVRAPVRDMTTGYKAYRKEILKRIDLDSLPNDFSFQPEILFMLKKAGARMIETPIEFHRRKTGKSKYGIIDLVGNLKILISAAFRR